MPRRLGASVWIVALGIGSLLAFGWDFRSESVARISAATAAEPTSENARHGFRTVTLRVQNMSCASCPYIVRRSLESVEGVVSARVSFREKTAFVTYDPAKSAVKDLVAATARNGFPSSVIR